MIHCTLIININTTVDAYTHLRRCNLVLTVQSMTADATHQIQFWIARTFHSSNDPYGQATVAQSDTLLGNGLMTCLYSAHLHKGHLQHTPVST